MSKVIRVHFSRKRNGGAMSFRQSIKLGPTMQQAEVVVCERGRSRWFHLRGIDGSLSHEELVQLHHAVCEALGIAKRRDADQRPGQPCPHCGEKFAPRGLAAHVRVHGRPADLVEQREPGDHTSRVLGRKGHCPVCSAAPGQPCRRPA